MIRVKGWENELNAVIEKHSQLPSEYGVSDCYLLVDDMILAITGERMYPDAIGYTSEIGAAKKLFEHGFTNVEDAFAGKFERIPVMMAQRGDIGVVENNGQICGGFFSAIGFVIRDETNVIMLPIDRVKSAFKVAR